MPKTHFSVGAVARREREIPAVDALNEEYQGLGPQSPSMRCDCPRAARLMNATQFLCVRPARPATMNEPRTQPRTLCT